jgi:hypothetical protein
VAEVGGVGEVRTQGRILSRDDLTSTPSRYTLLDTSRIPQSFATPSIRLGSQVASQRSPSPSSTSRPTWSHLPHHSPSQTPTPYTSPAYNNPRITHRRPSSPHHVASPDPQKSYQLDDHITSRSRHPLTHNPPVNSSLVTEYTMTAFDQ